MYAYFSGSTGLHTDLYELTMAHAYWQNGLYRKQACFQLHYRTPPFSDPYIIAAGLEPVIDFIRGFRFSVDDIQYLAGLKGKKGQPLFDESFLNYLQRMTFACTVAAVPEGTVVFPHTPLLRLEGPIIQAQLLETGLLNLINFSSLIATKAGQIVRAAEGDTVLEFGYRRAQGPDGALSASRAAYIGGCAATSNVRAGRAFGIPVGGTHAHSWVMCFDDEKEAFLAYAAAQPDNCIFLVDTYDTIRGVEHAIEAGRWLREHGHEMNGIRLDSGDLGELSRIARRMLDDAGFQAAVIVGSSDLDEKRIREIKAKGGQIRVWGVGTRLATAFEQPALGGVYKLTAITNEEGKWEPRIKLSEEFSKISTPGRLAVYRYLDAAGQPVADMIYDVDLGPQTRNMAPYNAPGVIDLASLEEVPLMQTIFEKGQLVYPCPSIHDIRARSMAQQSLWKKDQDYYYGLEINLQQRKEKLIQAKEEAR